MDEDLARIIDARIADRAAWQAVDLLAAALADIVVREDLWQAGDGRGGYLHQRLAHALAGRNLIIETGRWSR